MGMIGYFIRQGLGGPNFPQVRRRRGPPILPRCRRSGVRPRQRRRERFPRTLRGLALRLENAPARGPRSTSRLHGADAAHRSRLRPEHTGRHSWRERVETPDTVACFERGSAQSLSWKRNLRMVVAQRFSGWDSLRGPGYWLQESSDSVSSSLSSVITTSTLFSPGYSPCCGNSSRQVLTGGSKDSSYSGKSFTMICARTIFSPFSAFAQAVISHPSAGFLVCELVTSIEAPQGNGGTLRENSAEHELSELRNQIVRLQIAFRFVPLVDPVNHAQQSEGCGPGTDRPFGSPRPLHVGHQVFDEVNVVLLAS